MEIELLYWHWIVFGIALMLCELLLPSFTVLWLGAGGVLVGISVWLMPSLSLTAQLVLWTVFSMVLTLLWFKYLKPLSINKTMAGLSLEKIQGEVGQVIAVTSGKRRGKLRFPAPVLGGDEWSFMCEDDLTVGDRVCVTDVSGNHLIVKKI